MEIKFSTFSSLALASLINAGCGDPLIPNTSLPLPPDAGRNDFDIPSVDVPYDRVILERNIPADRVDAATPVDATVIQDANDAGSCRPEPCAGILLRERTRVVGGVFRQVYCLDFQDVSLSAGLTPHDVAENVSLIDFDGDSDSDILYVRHNQGPLLLENQSGHFVDATARAGLSAAQRANGVAVGDYDGDVRQDIALIGPDGSFVYHNNGASFSLVTNVFSPEDQRLPGRAAAFIGSRLMIGTEGGAKAYRFSSSWTNITSTSGLEDRAGEAWDIAVTRIDSLFHVYVANPTGRNRHFIEERSTGNFVSMEQTDGTVSLGDAAVVRGASVSASWVFFQGEVFPSLSVGTADQGNYLLVRETSSDAGVDSGMGVYRDFSRTLNFRDPGPTSTIAWGDFADDQRPWAFIGRFQDPTMAPRRFSNLLYVPTLRAPDNQIERYVDYALAAHVSTLTEEEPMNTVGARVFDYNRDGRSDLLIAYNNASQMMGGLRLLENRSRWVCP